MTVGDETREVEAGDAVYVPRGHRHTLRNTGSEPIKLILVCGPASSMKTRYSRISRRRLRRTVSKEPSSMMIVCRMANESREGLATQDIQTRCS